MIKSSPPRLPVMKHLEKIKGEFFEILKANKPSHPLKNSVKSESTPETIFEDDLFKRTRTFFIIGRLLGIVPFSGTFQSSYSNLNFRLFSFPCLTSILITKILIANLMLEFMQAARVPKKNAVEIAMAVKAPIFYGYGVFIWNYADLLIGVFGRAINFKFKTLYELTKRELVTERKNSNNIKRKGREPWLHLVKDHEILCNLIVESQKVLSPLIFISYAINVYMGLHTEDSGPGSIIHSIYAPWSLLHLGLRLHIVSISLARVNVFAHKIMDVISECPIEVYDKNISRLDRRVTTGPKIGFSGLGCFTVTKPFILQIIGVIFTFEIVLLQGSSAAKGDSQCCCKTTV
ncbi:unnamed protein product [Orchesella dallaii]|uniref:Gustatory receptor n=1 Tax=Orchesella dallaii TaxID=48710 RepID=A0ABP1QAC8_9HEXA